MNGPVVGIALAVLAVLSRCLTFAAEASRLVGGQVLVGAVAVTGAVLSCLVARLLRQETLGDGLRALGIGARARGCGSWPLGRLCDGVVGDDSLSVVGSALGI